MDTNLIAMNDNENTITKVTEKEIFEQIDKANENLERGEYFFGMRYEDGVITALNWVLNGEEPPME